MMFAVSSAAAALRSMQNTCALSRANVTAVALPLPQPGPIEPAPTTIAVLPLSRAIDFSFFSVVEIICSPDGALAKSGTFSPGLRFAPSGLRIACVHLYDIGANRMPEYFRQRAAISAVAQPPFAGGAGIGQHQLRHRRARRLPLKPAVDHSRVRRRLHAGPKTFYARLLQFQPPCGDAPVFLPVGLFDRMGPYQGKGGDRQCLHHAD